MRAPVEGKDLMADTVRETIAARASVYGEYRDQALLAITLQGVMRSFVTSGSVYGSEVTMTPFNCMDHHQIHALNMIMEKVARIITGNPHYDDNWRDIAGYATLVLDRLPKENENG